MTSSYALFRLQLNVSCLTLPLLFNLVLPGYFRLFVPNIMAMIISHFVVSLLPAPLDGRLPPQLV